MARAKVDFEFPKAAILWKLHTTMAAHEKGSFTAEIMAHHLNLPFQMIVLSIQELEDEGYCQTFQQVVGDFEEEETFVGITRLGIQHVENWDDEFHDDVVLRSVGPAEARAMRLLAAHDDDVDEEGEDDETVPASDRVVSLDHNSPDYKEAVAALDEFATEAEKSNEFGELFADPEDRIRVLSEVNSGIDLLKQHRVSVEAVKVLLMKPLKLVAENLLGAALGALASKALEYISKLFG